MGCLNSKQTRRVDPTVPSSAPGTTKKVDDSLSSAEPPNSKLSSEPIKTHNSGNEESIISASSTTITTTKSHGITSKVTSRSAADSRSNFHPYAHPKPERNATMSSISFSVQNRKGSALSHSLSLPPSLRARKSRATDGASAISNGNGVNTSSSIITSNIPESSAATIRSSIHHRQTYGPHTLHGQQQQQQHEDASAPSLWLSQDTASLGAARPSASPSVMAMSTSSMPRPTPTIISTRYDEQTEEEVLSVLSEPVGSTNSGPAGSESWDHFAAAGVGPSGGGMDDDASTIARNGGGSISYHRRVASVRSDDTGRVVWPRKTQSIAESSNNDLGSSVAVGMTSISGDAGSSIGDVLNGDNHSMYYVSGKPISLDGRQLSLTASTRAIKTGSFRKGKRRERSVMSNVADYNVRLDDDDDDETGVDGEGDASSYVDSAVGGPDIENGEEGGDYQGINSHQYSQGKTDSPGPNATDEYITVNDKDSSQS
ncbi:hypothetical protein HDU76_013341, partial [Blyttiomyces sp. JEL0837]